VPELPEISAAAAQLEAAIAGKTIASAEVFHAALARRLPARALASLAGRVVSGIARRGKHQLVLFADGSALVAHFRLNGEWDVAREGDALPRFARAVLLMTDGTRVALVDSRALSSLELAATPEAVLPRLGPEPMDAGFTPAALGAALARRRGAIKPALLDQAVVAGLGNIYAAEALWLARLSPFAPAAKLGPVRLARLVKAIRDVLRRAPAGRYWMDDRVTRWRVYDREGMRCRRCGGAVRRSVQAGRSTFHCPACQRR
jgi:formamidopyrimidine-DNA glycosylase